MSEQRLGEWVRGATFEQKCDILMQLFILAADGRSIGSDPSDVIVDDGDLVSVRMHGTNLAWEAPEVISSRSTGNPIAPAAEQLLYTLGLMAYWLFTGEDFYSKSGIDVIALPKLRSRLTYVVRSEDVASISCGSAIVTWTSVNPSQRAGGNADFLQYLMEHVRGDVRFVYMCDGVQVFEETRTENSVAVVERGETVQANGATYVVSSTVKAPYRPGTHTYTVKVVKQVEHEGRAVYIPRAYRTGVQSDFGRLERFLDLSNGPAMADIELKTAFPNCVLSIVEPRGGRGPEVVKTITVSKPQGFGGSLYRLFLIFDAERDKLYARLEDTMGHVLGVQFLGDVQ